MTKLLTTAAAALILLAAGEGVQAQLAPSLATLSPQGSDTADGEPSVAPPTKYVGPAPGATESANFGAAAGQTTVASSPKYVGPAPGAAEGANYAVSQKPAGL